MDPALQEIIRRDLNPNDIIEAVIKLRDERYIPPQIRVITQQKDIITCRVKRGAVRKVYNSEWVKSFKAPKSIKTEFHTSEHIPPPKLERGSFIPSASHRELTGKGVVVGVIDWGMDFAHPNFRHADGTTRLLALWDQSIDEASNLSQPYGYGKVFLKSDINQALQSLFPYHVLGYHPAKGDPRGIGAHGTHVMDIAAGSGRIGVSGIAPDAELVFVHLATQKSSPLANLGDSVRILEAIDFCL